MSQLKAGEFQNTLGEVRNITDVERREGELARLEGELARREGELARQVSNSSSLKQSFNDGELARPGVPNQLVSIHFLTLK